VFLTTLSSKGTGPKFDFTDIELGGQKEKEPAGDQGENDEIPHPHILSGRASLGKKSTRIKRKHLKKEGKEAEERTGIQEIFRVGAAWLRRRSWGE